MGAWGSGMRQNDSALDAISRVTYGKMSGSAVIQQYAQDPDDSPEVLGMAEWMLEHGVEIAADDRKLVVVALKRELRKTALKCWNDPEERRAALLRFKHWLANPDEKPEAPQDQEGLLSKMGKAIGKGSDVQG